MPSFLETSSTVLWMLGWMAAQSLVGLCFSLYPIMFFRFLNNYLIHAI